MQSNADTIFKEFKEHSISEFFRKNSQMLGYSGKVRSLTTIIHEYVSNSLDACEEAGILPEISVLIREEGDDKYFIKVADNGPGIPAKHVGKAFATILAGTKFHRYLQQRGQQGIGAAGCTMYAQITTGRPIHVRSCTGKESFECDITIDIKTNKPLVTGMAKAECSSPGLEVSGLFGGIKYEDSDHGVYEYLKRTALSNPHLYIRFIPPGGKEVSFPRSTDEMPKRPREIKPHPLGIGTNDLMEFAHRSESRKLSSFLEESFSRVTANKVNELKELAHEIDFEKDPHDMKWEEAEKLVKAFKEVKWIGPELDALSTIGEKQIEIAMKNILNPKFVSVVERKPKVFKGGIPFVVEAGIAYGGDAGKQLSAKGEDEQHVVEGNIIRSANKVPLLFDASNCAITEAAKSIQWKRYGIANFEEEPVSVFINISSVYIPYSGVGKQAVAQEDEIVEEIKLALMDCGRILQRYISGMRSKELQESRYKMIMRYVNQLSSDLSEITGKDAKEINRQLNLLIEKRYKDIFNAEKDDDAQEEKKAAETEPSAEES